MNCDYNQPTLRDGSISKAQNFHNQVGDDDLL